MNRRRFLGVGAAAAGAAACWRFPASLAATPSPVLSGGSITPLGAIRRLTVERADPLLGRCRYVADLGGQRIAQPIVVARRGDRFDAVIENRLPQPTTVHFHGLTLAEAQDGAGFDAIEPGAVKALNFEVRNRAGLYWFHAHPHGFTAEQVHAGLLGMLVVTDAEDAALDAALALAPGNRLALAVSDARVAGGLLRPYAPSDADCLHGWFGNRALVNGALDASLPVAPGWARLQLLNACNARGLLLAFRDGAASVPFHLLGTDGGLLAAPIALDRVFLYSAERVDIAIDVSGRRKIAAVSLAFDPRHHHSQHLKHGGGFAHLHPARGRYPPLAAVKICDSAAGSDATDFVPDGAELPVFTLDVGGATQAAVPPLPARISALPEAAAATDAETRRMRLDFDERAGFLIDNTPYRVDEVAFTVARGAREVWEVRNSPISMPHPMHVHGFGFRVLRRRGTFGPARALAQESSGRLPTDLGVKDTVVVWPNETVWLALDFSLPEDAAFRGRQRYMLHCHNLEHEDGMMMRNYAVL
ncbi:MAG TPA: multicopper oxidase family protein [Burkholderiales bacterium]|nr:multicopper oxidase family protein [Burkholderiales bacterium]